MPLDDLDDLGDGVLGQQHAAENRLLGVEVLGGTRSVAGSPPWWAMTLMMAVRLITLWVRTRSGRWIVTGATR
ncbi:hypothetical protein SCALM49S_06455 [Streptomyces californicus]